jgi:hypothetical protein
LPSRNIPCPTGLVWWENILTGVYNTASRMGQLKATFAGMRIMALFEWSHRKNDLGQRSVRRRLQLPKKLALDPPFFSFQFRRIYFVGCGVQKDFIPRSELQHSVEAEADIDKFRTRRRTPSRSILTPNRYKSMAV